MRIGNLTRRLTLIVIAVLLSTAVQAPATEPASSGAARSVAADASKSITPPPTKRTARATATTTWTSYPIFGGEMTSIASHPTQSDIAWVGTRDGGVFKTLDGGQTWATILDGIAFVRDIGYDLLFPGQVYAATEGQDVLRSVDGGTTWSDFSDGIFYPVLDSLAFSTDRRLVTGSYGSGLYWSSLAPDWRVIFADGLESGDLSAWSV